MGIIFLKNQLPRRTMSEPFEQSPIVSYDFFKDSQECCFLTLNLNLKTAHFVPWPLLIGKCLMVHRLGHQLLLSTLNSERNLEIIIDRYSSMLMSNPDFRRPITPDIPILSIFSRLTDSQTFDTILPRPAPSSSKPDPMSPSFHYSPSNTFHSFFLTGDLLPNNNVL